MEYNIGVAKNNLPKLIKLALSGQQVTITHRGKPVVELVPAARKRQFGTMPGLLDRLPSDWEARLQDESWVHNFDFIRDQEAERLARQAGKKSYRTADGATVRIASRPKARR